MITNFKFVGTWMCSKPDTWLDSQSNRLAHLLRQTSAEVRGRGHCDWLLLSVIWDGCKQGVRFLCGKPFHSLWMSCQCSMFVYEKPCPDFHDLCSMVELGWSNIRGQWSMGRIAGPNFSDVPGLLKDWEYLNLFKTNLWFYSFVLFVDQLRPSDLLMELKSGLSKDWMSY